jgi:hypothetical protein
MRGAPPQQIVCAHAQISTHKPVSICGQVPWGAGFSNASNNTAGTMPTHDGLRLVDATRTARRSQAN